MKSPALRPQFALLQISQLRVGVTLSRPIYEERADQDVLLLAAGTTITDCVLETLRQRGLTHVRVHGRDARALTERKPSAPADPIADISAEESSSRGWGVNADSFCRTFRDPGKGSYDKLAASKIVASYDASVTQVENLFRSLSVDAPTDGAGVAAASRESLVQMVEDLDLFIASGINVQRTSYPFSHSVQTSMLAGAVGAFLGLRQSELVELSIGCMIHDSGMLHVDKRLYDAPRILTPMEFLEITKHPVYTFEIVKNIPEIPPSARMVAYQMHERWNGSGYPRRRQGRQIHYLARIAGMVDTFVALISPRPHRPGLLPYYAMETMIHSARKGLFEPEVVRGLLHTLSLFPVGSFVEMNDGRVGKVIRANREHFTTPILELWRRDALDAAPEVVDLSTNNDLQVVRPIHGLHSPAERAGGTPPTSPLASLA